MRFINIFKDNLYLTIAVVIAAILRLLWLDRVSPAIGGDELNYIITAKFIALRWTDLSGTWNPLSIFLFHYPQSEFQAEISYFLLLPIVKLLPLTVFNAKIVFGIFSISTVIVMYVLAQDLFGKRVGFSAAFLIALNPWSIFLGRTAYEMGPETVFYLLSIFLLLKLKGNKIYYALPILLMAFYSHIATKVIFFPIVFTVLTYSYFKNHKFRKQYFFIGLFALLLTLFFVITIKLNPAFSRTSEIVNPNDPLIVEVVDYARKTTIGNNLNYIFTNKITVFANIIISKIARTISPEYLFISGDQFYSLYTHGFFYIIDFIFIGFGMLYAFAKDKRKFFLVFSIACLSMVPHIIHTTVDNFVPQISLLFPILLLFCANGIVGVYESLNKKFVLLVIILIYIFSLFNFLNIYFYQYPLKETFDFKIRVLSKYISFNDQREKITIYSSSSNDYFKKYLFYRDLINDESADQISDSFSKGKYSIGNVAFTDCNTFNESVGISIVDENCKKTSFTSNYLKIARLVDGGSNFRIYNDRVCSKLEHDTYATGVLLSDFSVEKLTKDRFCKIYLIR